MTQAEFMEVAGELLTDAERRGRNVALASIKTIVRRTKMNETTKQYLLNQIETLRR